MRKSPWNRLRRAAVPIVVAGACAVTPSALAGIAAADSAPTQSPVQVQPVESTPAPPGTDAHKQQLRQKFGLRSDLAWVQQVGKAAGSQTDQLGIPLTPAESGEIDTRSRRLVAVADAVEKAKGAVPGFGGLWIDQAAGGVVHVLGANIDAAGRGVLQRAAGQGSVLDNVAVSRSTLEAAQQKIVNYALKNKSFKDVLVSAGVNEKLNLVEVSLSSGAGPEQAATARRVAGTDRVSVSETSDGWVTESRNRPNTFPLYGGQWTENCTVGFSNAQIATAARQMVTAGHCFPNGNGVFLQGLAGTPQGDLVGSTIANSLRDGTNCDCQTVGTLNNRLPTSSVITGPTQTFKYTNTASAGNYAIGQRACLSGAAYGDANNDSIGCGTITTTSTAVRVRDGAFVVNDVALTDIVGSFGGDSGGPYGNGGSFLGIHTAGKRSEAPFSTATAFSKSTNFGAMDSRIRLIY